jgi:hypothetical protein
VRYSRIALLSDFSPNRISFDKHSSLTDFTQRSACDFAQRGFDPGRLPDNLIWYYIWAVAMLAYMISRGLRYFTGTYEGIS